VDEESTHVGSMYSLNVPQMSSLEDRGLIYYYIVQLVST
jgi:hypothetical protein